MGERIFEFDDLLCAIYIDRLYCPVGIQYCGNEGTIK